MDAGAFAGGAAGGLGGPSRDWRSHNKDRDPPPSLGGENPAHNPKRSGKALRFWKHNTAVPPEPCGSKLYKTMPLRSAHYGGGSATRGSYFVGEGLRRAHRRH